MSGVWKPSRGQLLRHRQTKGPVTARRHLNYGATCRLHPADGVAADPAAEETKRKRVMNKIRGIFGLSPLPEDADSEEAEDPCPESDEERQDDGTRTGQGEAPAAGSSGPSQNCAPSVNSPNGATSS